MGVRGCAADPDAGSCCAAASGDDPDDGEVRGCAADPDAGSCCAAASGDDPDSGEDRGDPADPDAGASASNAYGGTDGDYGGTDDNHGCTDADDGGADGECGRTDAHYLWRSPYDFVSACACHKRPSLDGRLGVLSEVASSLSPICDLAGMGDALAQHARTWIS